MPASEDLPSDEEVPQGTERILVIDDEATVARMHGRLLESLGYAVTVETSPLEALTTFSANPQAFDLVVTDMTMPKMNGTALTERLLGIRSDIPVILCTGFSELVNETKAIDLGVKAFAMKPLMRRSMASLVRKVLSGAT
jgi:CheY-like chemotaxis protein